MASNQQKGYCSISTLKKVKISQKKIHKYSYTSKVNKRDDGRRRGSSIHKPGQQIFSIVLSLHFYEASVFSTSESDLKKYTDII